MAENFYGVLGVTPTASGTDIRKAYRQLAMKWHPDKNPQNLVAATEKFKQISEAYEILGDVGTRTEYDRLQTAGRTQFSQYDRPHSSTGFHAPRGDGFSGRRAQDIFDQFFSTFRDDFFEGQFPQHRMQQRDDRRPNGFQQSNHFANFGMPFGGDPFRQNGFFADPFSNFGSNFGGMSSSSSHSSSYSSNGFSGKSVSVTTTIDHRGKAVIRKETTTHHPDGTSETVVEDSIKESPQQVAYNDNGRQSFSQVFDNGNHHHSMSSAFSHGDQGRPQNSNLMSRSNYGSSSYGHSNQDRNRDGFYGERSRDK